MPTVYQQLKKVPWETIPISVSAATKDHFRWAVYSVAARTRSNTPAVVPTYMSSVTR